MKTPFEIDAKLNLTLLLYAYAIVLGAAYIFAFWRPFGFNIFPYLAVKDFVTVPFNRLSILLAPLLLFALLQLGELSQDRVKQRSQLLHLVLVCALASAIIYFIQALLILISAGAFYQNEKSIFFYGALVLVLAISLAVRAYTSTGTMTHAVLSIVLAQIVMVVSNGYKDGKTLFRGALPALYLQQKELCSPPKYGNWVYIDKYGSNAVFMNTIDKRLCLIDKFHFNLIDRTIAEALWRQQLNN